MKLVPHNPVLHVDIFDDVHYIDHILDDANNI